MVCFEGGLLLEWCFFGVLCCWGGSVLLKRCVVRLVCSWSSVSLVWHVVGVVCC